MTGSTRIKKRLRATLTEGKPTPTWGEAVTTLIERLNAIRADAIALRDEHLLCASEIQEKISAKEAASRAVAKVIPPPPSHDVDVFSRGVRVSSPPVQRPTAKLPPVPAMKLLMEPDPLEKSIHEQSVIVRAQAINRKNAELARERLPKQPEAQHNKTWQDYFLDEATWMATDFREERKWKVQMARRISKMVMQYHNQRAQREARAKVEAHLKVVKLAGSIARDVRKFWNQIAEIADYRSSLVEEARLAKERQSQLQQLLDRTEAYSSVLASSLRTPPRVVQNKVDDNLVKKVMFVDSGTGLGDRGTGSGEVAECGKTGEAREVPIHNVKTVQANPVEIAERRNAEDIEDPSDASNEGSPVYADADMDDETTIVAAEAETGDDPHEVGTLQGEAEMSVEELLRSQGIDPDTYKADKNQYLDDEEDKSDCDDDEMLDDGQGELDDESTMIVAEAEEERDPGEIGRLEGEAEMTVEELLRSQGIDPSVYKADTRKFTEVDAESEDEDCEKFAEGSRGECEREVALGKIPSADVYQPLLSTSSDTKSNSTLEGRSQPSMATLQKTILTVTGCKSLKDGSNDPESSRPNLERVVQEYVLNGKPDEDEKCHQLSGRDAPQTDLSNGPIQSRECTSQDPICSSNVSTGKPPEAVSGMQHGNRVPSQLLRGSLRDYQKAGMDWLISLYNQKLNGILADEMGLGKTIQTISLLAWLAVEKGIWGPHLIVVPTSVIVNWEVEFKKWLPGFKILTYFGSMKERKQKRQGWTKPNTFHVCITSYTLAVQDASALRRKKWVYLILDEAHNIKNFESQRWQTLLNFSSRRRLLITGTPLQNSIMELWSLMHFLMPDVFSSHAEFKDWFSKPLAKAAEEGAEKSTYQTEIVSKLHKVLRPFVLRRLKADVEKGLPPKFEHIVKCPLSKRQRQLYEDFMARSDIQETLDSGDFFGVMNVLMQLRKVCNHPDLFEGRPIVSPFSMKAIFFPIPAALSQVLVNSVDRTINLDLLGLDLCTEEVKGWRGYWHAAESGRISAVSSMREELVKIGDEDFIPKAENGKASTNAALLTSRRIASFRRSTLRHQAQVTALRLRQRALLGEDLRTVCTMSPKSLVEAIRVGLCHSQNYVPKGAQGLLRSIEAVGNVANVVVERFVCCVTRASAPVVEMRFRGDDMLHRRCSEHAAALNVLSGPYRTLFRPFEVRSQVTLPDTRLIQWDCGKLQVLDKLLRQLQSRGSRSLIFTQMTKVLDVLESFLNLHSHRYLRLDGATKTDDRQKIVERFNTDRRIFCMILTTRAGGIGLNLTGADTVIFYDTDYNPAIDGQAQDRAHRIGQTKPVHIYRLVSEQTVEENILRRANEKRSLESRVISEAGFTTEAIRRLENQNGQPDGIGENVFPDISKAERVAPGNPVPGTQGPNGVREVSAEGKVLPKGNCANVTFPVQARNGIETAGGLFTFFGSGPGDGVKPDPNTAHVVNCGEGHPPKYMHNYQDVASSILAAEDDRERLALHAAEEERREELAEFDEAASGVAPSNPDNGTRTHRVPSNYINVETSLTPVQRYALRLVESRMDAVEDGIDDHEEAKHPLWESEFTVSEMLKRRRKNSDQDMKVSDGVVVAADFLESEEKTDLTESDPQYPEDIEPGATHISSALSTSREDDAAQLVYEVDISQAGQLSYLKALTDADADIKLYLPLRDGGPEELKISTVVNGTAAAGLECAEDAAFFPHAYNRMSRTPFATRRQKEKALANLRKRKAEKELKRQREAQMTTAVLQKEKAAVAVAAAQTAKQANVPERPKGVKNKIDSSVRNTGGPPSKKMRLDGGPKSRGASGSNSNGPGDLGLSGQTGLFKKSTKKSTKRLSMANAKSSGNNANASMPGEGFGLNDGWTRDEDQRVIAIASEFNNNMCLVADVLSLDPCVRAGLRRRRGHKHCLDRLVNSLGKDIKTGPPVPRATISDTDMYRKHCDALTSAASTIRKKPPVWMVLPPDVSDIHQSHVKAIAEAASKAKGRITGDGPPTMAAVSSSITEPPHHKAGFKPTETTPQALNRIRYPFLRPIRDDPRSLQQQAGTAAGYVGSGSRPTPSTGGTTSFYGKSTAKAPRSQSQASAARGAAGINRNPSSGRPPALAKASPDTAPSRQPSSKLTPAYSSTAKKGNFVPGTSARMSIGQYSGGVQNLQKPAIATLVEGKGEPSRKPPSTKTVQQAVRLKSSGLATTGIRPSLKTPSNDPIPNGSVKGSNFKVTVKNGVGYGAMDSSRKTNTVPLIRPTPTPTPAPNPGLKEIPKQSVDMRPSGNTAPGQKKPLASPEKSTVLAPDPASQIPSAKDETRTKDNPARKS